MRFLVLLILSQTLSACSIYSSAGRKQFEEHAPSNIVTTFSLLGCHQLSAGETWLKEEFPSTESDLVEMTADYEVWSKITDKSRVEVTVLSDGKSNDQDRDQSCVYEFSSPSEWKLHKKAFLEDLANNSSKLD